MKEQAEHGPAQAQVHPVSAAALSATGTAQGRHLLPKGHCSPAAPGASPLPEVPQPPIHFKHSLLLLMEIPHYGCIRELWMVTANSEDPSGFLLLLPCNRSSIQGILCPCTREPSEVLVSFLEGR